METESKRTENIQQKLRREMEMKILQNTPGGEQQTVNEKH